MALKDLAFKVSLNTRDFNSKMPGVQRDLNRLARTRLDGLTREMGKLIKEGKTLKDVKFKELVSEFRDVNNVIRLTERTSRNARRGIERSFRRMNINWKSAFRIAVATQVLGGLVKTAANIGKSMANQMRASFMDNMTKADTERMFGAIMNNAVLGRAVADQLRNYAMMRSLNIDDVVGVGRSILTQVGNDPRRMMQMLKIAERLTLLNPNTSTGGGFEGAGYALMEAEGGDYMSLRRRFNIGGNEIERLRSQGLEGADLVDQILKMKGITDAAAAQQTRTARAWMTSISNFVGEMRRTIGEGVFMRINALGSSVQNWIQTVGPKFLDMARGFGMMLADGFAKAVEWARSLVPVIMPAVEKIMAIVNYLFQSGKVGNFIAGVADTIVNAARYVVALIQSIDFNKIGQSLLNMIKSLGSLLFDMLMHITDVIIVKIKGALPSYLGGGISSDQQYLDSAWARYGDMTPEARENYLKEMRERNSQLPAGIQKHGEVAKEIRALEAVQSGQRLADNHQTMGSIFSRHASALGSSLPTGSTLPAMPDGTPVMDMYQRATAMGAQARAQRNAQNAWAMTQAPVYRPAGAQPNNSKLAGIMQKQNAAVAQAQGTKMNITFTSLHGSMSPVQATIGV